MKSVAEPAVLLIVLVALATGCITGSSSKPDWAQNVNWVGEKPDSAAAIEAGLWTQIAPYNMKYDIVNITVKSEDAGLRLRVVGISNDIVYPDIYDFTYSDGLLSRTGYLLEAVPPQDRDAAISIAMQSKEVRDAGVTGIPTVRRILPDTSKKYYAPKTLLSVTWAGVSALVDPDERKVVKVWNAEKSVR